MEISENKKYIPVQDLEVYKLARELSRQGWSIYQSLLLQCPRFFSGMF